ncbi:MAG: tRNA uridine-5-carboxymethylaminomethyl(34) synthesis enzyme MnmG, partial [Spirochaetota bacterium]
GYVARQQRQIARFEKLESMQIPAGFDYDAVRGISNESREKLKEIRPLSLGQASRVPGVRNADVAVLMVALDRRQEPVVQIAPARADAGPATSGGSPARDQHGA